MAQRVCIIGGGVIGLATAYALVREGFDVTLIEARPTLGSQTSFANGGQLSYRYVAPLADAGVPWQALGWMLRGDSPLKLRPRMDPAQWRWLASFVAPAGARSISAMAHTCCVWHCSARPRCSNGAKKIIWTGSNGGATANWWLFVNASHFEKARQKVIHSSFQQALTASECSAWSPACKARHLSAVFTPRAKRSGDCHAFCQQLFARLQASWPLHIFAGQNRHPSSSRARCRQRP
jgi:D-amino-acid dehydrogenase